MTTIAWLITYSVDGVQQCTAHMHNAIADYRAFDPNATITAIDLAAVGRVIDAAGSVLFDAIPATQSSLTCYVGAYQLAALRDALASVCPAAPPADADAARPAESACMGATP